MPAGHLVRALKRSRQLATAAAGAGVRLRADQLAPTRAVARGRRRREAAPALARRAACGRRTGLDPGLRECLPHPREKGGETTGPSPVSRGQTGSKHHLICDGRGTPFKVITTAANVNDVAQPGHGRRHPGRGRQTGPPSRRPDALLGDKGYDRTPTGVSCASAGSCRSSPAGAPRTSRSWASSATSASRPSHSCTTSSG